MSPNSITLNLDYFETIILYKILSDNHYANLVINNLEPQYFNSKDKKIIFNLIKNYYLTNDKLPNISEIKQYLSTNELQQSFINVINEIKNTDKQINEQELIKNTEHFIKERGIFNIIWNVAKQENIEPYIILEKIQNICNVSLDTDAGLDLYNDVDDIINKLTTPNSYIKTGWKWLDNCIDGGWLKDGNALYVFYGRPNIGKSIILGNMADNIAKQGYNVMIITLEMNEYLYAKRLLSRITHIPIKHLTSDVDVLKNAIEQNKKGNIFIKEFPTGAVNPQYVGSYIEQLKKKGIKIDAVVLDYIDLLVWPGNIEEHLKKKKIAENLRGWSTKLKIPIISADQINREGYDETPDMKFAAGGTGNNVTADLLVGISRTDEDVEMGLIRFNIMKNRNGPANISKCMKIDMDTLDITEDDTLDQIEEHKETYSMFEDLSES